MNFNRIYGLFLRHMYLIIGSIPRIIDLVYWPTIQILLWGFISKFFTLNSDYYNNTVGVILTAAILYDFLFRSSISYNIMFLEEQQRNRMRILIQMPGKSQLKLHLRVKVKRQ